MSCVVICEGNDFELNRHVRVVLDRGTRDMADGRIVSVPVVTVEARGGCNAMGEPIWQDISNEPRALRIAMAALAIDARAP